MTQLSTPNGNQFYEHPAPIPPGADFAYSAYGLDPGSPLAGGCAWIEGQFVPVSEARISIFDHGFRYSDVTYTGISVWAGKVFRLEDHLDRFLEGAQRLGLEAPHSRERIRELCLEAVEKAQLREAFILVCLTGGRALPLAYSTGEPVPEMYLYCVPYRWVFSPAQQMGGIDVVVARTVNRVTQDSIDPTIKNFSWGDLTRGRREASRLGATSALLLDKGGVLTEGPGFNVFIVQDGTLATPARNCLPGITRRTIIEIAERKGFRVEVRDVYEQELREADEIFATTTAGGVTPIVSLDGAIKGNGFPGEVTTKLLT